MKSIIASFVVTALLILGNAIAIAAPDHPVKGSACYQYGDNETPLSAKKMATELAKRNAMENYITYVAAATRVENFELKKDSILSASSGYLHDMKIVSDQKKDREYCISINAKVDPDEVKNLMKVQVTEVKTESKARESDGSVSLGQWSKISESKGADSIEKIKGGEIDWGKRVIRVTGFGAANKSFPKHVWKKDAEDNALLDAQIKIVEISKGVDLEAKKYVENYQTREQSARKSVEGRVKKAYQIGKTKFSNEEDSAEVVMEAKLPEE